MARLEGRYVVEISVLATCIRPRTLVLNYLWGAEVTGTESHGRL